MFIRSGELVRIDADEKGRPIIRSVSDTRVRWAIGQAADYVTIVPRKRGDVITPTIPPIPVARNILASADLCSWFPPLIGIIESPGILPDGRLLLKPGYDEASGLYYAPSSGLVVPPIPETPTAEDVAAAAELLRDVVCDFPFVVNEESKTPEASKTNAIAAIMTPILRSFVPGNVPISLFDKPASGTGASLLAKLVGWVATGNDPAMMPPPKSDEEWEKKIVSALIAGRSIIIIDNVEGRFYAPALASAITTDPVSGRILGQSVDVSIPQRSTWIATGNNIQLSGDLPRRCYWIRMDAKAVRPWQRERKYKHPNLRKWVLDNRGRIIAAILTLARAWMCDGAKPDPETPKLGGFEEWTNTIGGILKIAGIPGFLGNLEELYSETDTDGPQWAAFLEKWYEIWKSESITVNALTRYLQDVASTEPLDISLLGALPEDIAAAYTRPTAFTRVLGAALRHRNQTRYPNGYWLERQKETKKNALQWRVRFDPDLVVS